MENTLWWDPEDAEHIRRRSARYPGAYDLEPAWIREAEADTYRVVREPDPKSHVGYTRIIGYSQALRDREQAGLTQTQVEDVARRVVREELEQYAQ